uniref:Uncharacterized protein n=1 Tax=Heterorhabditis bacteriophora TaxID=37862 RepID=A0A1I7WY58_HETBA
MLVSKWMNLKLLVSRLKLKCNESRINSRLDVKHNMGRSRQ